jgi:D-3-phosphoglycerate dehydrogenase
MPAEERLKFVVPGDEPIQIQESPHLERLDRYGDLELYTDRPSSMEEQLRRVEDADVIINTRGAVKWFRPALESLPKLRMIATCSIGTDMIDLEAASELGIVVSNQPGRIAPIVGEHIVALMFAVAKRMAFQTSELKAGRWTRMENLFLQGKTLGLIGTGNVGREVGRLANALGMKVIAWTFNPSPERAAELGISFVELDDLLQRSDVVSIQVKVSDDSRQMIGRREFGLMKKGALFINGGRGELVDTAALIDALDSGHLAGAGVDVYDQEPLPPDDPILACEQVVLTPHVADQTAEGMELLNEGAVSNVIAFLEGRPQNVANDPRPRP